MTDALALCFIALDLAACGWLLTIILRITSRAGGSAGGHLRARAIWLAAGGVVAKIALAIGDALGLTIAASPAAATTQLAAEHATSALLAGAVLLFAYAGFRSSDTKARQRKDLLRHVGGH